MGAIRVARIIARLNIGGPARQAIALTSLLEPRGYETLLIRGTEASHEGSMDELARDLGVEPHLVRAMGREVGAGDPVALAELVRVLRRFRPHIVHTHAAKAGALGRVAALLARPRRPPLLVHTYHGHSLEGYFPPARERAFRAIERALARRTTRLVAVAGEVRDDLVRLGVAPRDRFEVIPLGFDLSPFQLDGPERAARRAALREALRIPRDVPLVTLIARLVPIKRVDRFLRVAAELARSTDARFLVVGDGELGGKLRRSAPAAELGDRLTWAGFRSDVAEVCLASDVVVLTSDNEGTPVSLIEAQAAGVPVASTRVGGAPTAVRDGLTGRLVDPADEAGLARAVEEILADGAAADRMGAAGREHALRSFSLERLVDDVERLYADLMQTWR